jgi:carbamoyltransferase
MPAASDRGLSLGAAMEALRTRGTTPATPKTMLLGSGFTPSQIISTLKRANVEFMELEDPNLRAAEYISEGRILGWFNGRAEFGPRALGARSIIARADVDGMKDSINKKIKFREKYRPFAPAVLESELCEVDHNPLPLRYMTIAIRPDQRIRAHINQAVHKDGTARIQAINSGHPLEKVLTNLQVGGLFPGVINTSFNLAGEPIVNSPIDALRTFFSSGMDALIMENILVTK